MHSVELKSEAAPESTSKLLQHTAETGTNNCEYVTLNTNLPHWGDTGMRHKKEKDIAWIKLSPATMRQKKLIL